MPLYEYQCESCAHRFERIQKFSDPLVDTCPICAGPVRKLLSSPAIQFKGSGWYITDYARKGGKSDSTAKGGDSAKRDSGDSKSSSDSAASAPATDTKSTKTE